MSENSQFEMVRVDPPRALPDSYDQIKQNIERVKMSASGEWFLIARFETFGMAGSRRSTLKKRSEYQLFEFRSAKLDPPEPPYTSGLWCKWIGVKKKHGQRVEPEPERSLRSVPR